METVVGILIILLNTCLVVGFIVLIAKSALPRARGFGLKLKGQLDDVGKSAGRWLRDQPAALIGRAGCGKCSGVSQTTDAGGYKTA